MKDEGKKIGLIIADDHNMMLEGLVSALDHYDDMEILGTANNGRAALQKARKLKPQAVVLDIQMPGMNGIESARMFKKELPETKIMAISMYADKRLVADMLKAGADGFVLKECAVKELAHGIRMLVDGETYICSRMVKQLVEHFVQGGEIEVDTLSPRERELLQLLAEGGNTKEISKCMSISTKTVETHRRRLMEKLGLKSVAGLTKYAIREGVTSLDY